jgi:GAF domain-containing protein
VAAELTASDTVEQTVEQITAFTAQTFGTQHAGVTLVEDGGTFRTAGPTDPSVRTADDLQNVLREGPCVEAATTSRSVVSNDVARDPRWPSWGPRIAALGLGSILSSDLHGGGRRVGALNVYGPTGHVFTPEDLELGQVLAQQASVALRFSEKIEGLTTALHTRTVIGQAQGVLIERYRVDADRAFDMKRFSQDQNIRLAEIARRIVADAVPDPSLER